MGGEVALFLFLHYESYGRVVIVYLVRFSTITIEGFFVKGIFAEYGPCW